MPDRQAQQRLDDWRSAERAEVDTTDGSVARQRAHATSRRARWSFEDAARAAATDHGGAPETFDTTMRRALTRMHEASGGADEITQGREGKQARSETDGQRDDRLADEAEFRRELGE